MCKSITLIFSIVLIGLLILASCDKGDTDEFSQDYFPLHVGNYWKTTGWTDTIDKIENLDGRDYYRMINIFPSGIHYDTAYYRKTADGKVFMRSRRSTGEILRFDLTAKVGQTWNYTLDLIDNRPWDATLFSKTDVIQLGNDTIKNCYRYYFDIPGVADEESCRWLGPDIGFVLYNYGQASLGGYRLTKVRINGVERQF